MGAMGRRFPRLAPRSVVRVAVFGEGEMSFRARAAKVSSNICGVKTSNAMPVSIST